MIIGRDITPKRKIYYLGAQVIGVLNNIGSNEVDFFELFHQMNKKEKISIGLFSLTLDWLFVLNVIEMKGGIIKKCF